MLILPSRSCNATGSAELNVVTTAPDEKSFRHICSTKRHNVMSAERTVRSTSRLRRESWARVEGAITTKRRAHASNSVSRSSGAFGPRAQPPNTIITIAAWRQYGDAEVFEKLLFLSLTPCALAVARRGVLRPPPLSCNP